MESKNNDRESPYLWSGSSFVVVRSLKRKGCIEVQTHGLDRLDAVSLGEFLLRWSKEKDKQD